MWSKIPRVKYIRKSLDGLSETNMANYFGSRVALTPVRRVGWKVESAVKGKSRTEENLIEASDRA